MDFDDLEEAPKATSRVSKFAPKSSKLKPKPKAVPGPKTEPPPQPQSEPSISKPEPQEIVATVKKNQDDVETVAPIHIKPELNTDVQMETEPKSEPEDEAEAGRDDPMDEDTPEDTVIREIDVFFTPSIDAETQVGVSLTPFCLFESALYVFQYPLRPSWRPYDIDDRCEEVRLKPESSEVELDLPIDMESSNIDREFANKHNVTKQTYATSWKPPRAGGQAATAAGLLMGDKLHLHPIHAVVQLRPKLHHLNSGGSKRKNVTSAGANATVKIEGSNEEKPVATSKKQNKPTEPSIEQKNDEDEVEFQYKSIAPQTWPVCCLHLEVLARRSSLVAGKAASLCYHSLSLLLADSAGCPFGYVVRVIFPFSLSWLPLKYHSCKSDLSSRYLEQMMGQESSPMNFTMRAFDYVTALCPGGTSNNLSKVPSKRDLLSLPVEERLKKMLETYPPQRFSAIKHFVPEYSEEEILKFLQQHAILLWGLWTAKSSLLYPNGGVESLARDYVLLMFSKNLKVQSSDMNVRGELTAHVKEFLKHFGLETANLDKSAGEPKPYWKFKERPDESFKKLYPDIVEKQERLFKGLEQHLPGLVSNAGKRKIGKSAVANQGVNNEALKSASSDQGKTSLAGVSTGKMTMSNETRHALPIALKKLFQTNKVCRYCYRDIHPFALFLKIHLSDMHLSDQFVILIVMVIVIA
ncbi:hypothetical protein V8G54_016842 [Vigna mungo]|uniref:DNA-directed RNA polymerase III subunit RPC5 n=1 Tax=Vigna mungo TaxID=3915 RepID=A0AAQ3NNA4_VIGMU